jgi:transposase
MAVAVAGGALTKAQAARVYAAAKIVSRWIERFEQDGCAMAAARRGSRTARGREVRF